MIHEVFPLSHWVNVAQRNTQEVASLADYKLRSKRNFALRDIARSLEKGYIIATANELRKRYGDLFGKYKFEGPDEDKKFVWALAVSVNFATDRSSRIYKKYAISFCPICR
jgi:hypothetical protein